MVSTQPVPMLVEYLHNLLPCILAIYFLAALTLSACIAQKVRDVTRREQLQRRSIFLLMLAVASTYATEAGLIIPQIFTSNGPMATRDSNIYALSSTLVWTVLIGLSVSIERPKWWPFYTTWICALFAELLLFGPAVCCARHFTSIERGQLAVKILRIVLISALPTSYFFLRAIDYDVVKNDEESAPLLKDDQVKPEETQNPGLDSGYGATLDTGSSVTTDDDAEGEAKELQKEAEKLKKISDRLQENGNWFTYLKEFLIFLPYIWPERRWDLLFKLMGVGFCLVIDRILNLLVPRQLGIVVNTLTHGSAKLPFIELGIYMVLVGANSNAGITALHNYLYTPIELYVHKSLTTSSYNHIMSLSCDFHDNKSSGELYTAMRQGSSMIDLVEMFAFRLIPMLVDLAVACGYLYILFDGYMAVIVAASVIFYIWVSAIFIRATSTAYRRLTRNSRKEYQTMFDYMGGWKTVSYFNRMDDAKDKYEKVVSQGVALKYFTWLLYYWQSGVTGLTMDIGLACASFYAVYQIVYGNNSVGSFVTLLTYWSGLSGPLYTLVRAYRDMLNNLISAEELLELYKTKPSVPDGPESLEIDKGEIKFEDVTFSYDGKKENLKDLNFHARAGRTVALIGETGGGKSTILKLIFRFYDATKGTVFIDGHDVRNLTLESLRENIGVVPQDPTLFNDTVMANVRFARLDATDAEVIDACKAAAVHDKIMTFTDKYFSKVGERGVKLSGGELQRIAIARAILKKPKIILLDEATSAVDSTTEGQIQEALKKLSEGRTTFVVAHRLSTIVNADLILVIKDGTILEHGPPKELLKTKGKYFELWSKQMGLDVDKSKLEELVSFSISDDSTELESDVNTGDMPVADKTGRVDALTKDASTDPAKSSAASSPDSPTNKPAFRPDAPGLVPLDQNPLLARASTTYPVGQSKAANGSSKNERKSKNSKGKASQDSVIAIQSGSSDDVASSSSNLTSPLSKIIKDSEPKTKKSRFARRKQTKSAPGAQGLDTSQGDGTSEYEVESIGADVGPIAALNPRRVSAPSDPIDAVASMDNSRRQRHWRSRNGGISSTRTSGTVAPFNSPANGTATPTNLIGNVVTRVGVLSSNSASDGTPSGSLTSTTDTGVRSANGAHIDEET